MNTVYKTVYKTVILIISILFTVPFTSSAYASPKPKQPSTATTNTATAESSASNISHSAKHSDVVIAKLKEFNAATACLFSLNELPTRKFTVEEILRFQNFQKPELLATLRNSINSFKHLENEDMVALSVCENQIMGETLSLGDTFMTEKRSIGTYLALVDLYNSFDTLTLKYGTKFSQIEPKFKKLQSNFNFISQLTIELIEGVSTQSIPRRQTTIDVIEKLEAENQQLINQTYTEFCNCRYSLHEISIALSDLVDGKVFLDTKKQTREVLAKQKGSLHLVNNTIKSLDSCYSGYLNYSKHQKHYKTLVTSNLVSQPTLNYVESLKSRPQRDIKMITFQ